jgi:hypothetical protein
VELTGVEPVGCPVQRSLRRPASPEAGSRVALLDCSGVANRPLPYPASPSWLDDSVGESTGAGVRLTA